jgi:hypothetical protein
MSAAIFDFEDAFAAPFRAFFATFLEDLRATNVALLCLFCG